MIQFEYLCKVLNTGDASLLTTNNLDESFFSDYSGEFRYIKSHIQQYGNVPDKLTFLGAFPDFPITEVQESNKYLLDALYEDRNKRFLAKSFNQVREALQTDRTEDALKIFSDAAQNLIVAKHIDSVDIFQDTSRYNSYIDKCSNFYKYYVKTGFDALDQVLGGWDRKEELATIVARPGTGKSWVLLKVALAAAEQGLRVGLYSGEMSEELVGYRIDTLKEHLSNTKIIRGNSSIQALYKNYLDTVKSTIKGSIRVITPSRINGTAGVSALRSFIERDHLDMLCIDQHSLLEDDRGARNPVDRAANISKDLKNLQTLVNIPIIAVSQQNRESVESGLSTSLISQSDRIGQDSTVVIFLEQKDSVLTMTLVKARNSITGKKLQYAVDFDKGVFTFIPAETDATNGEECAKLKDEYEEVEGSSVF